MERKAPKAAEVETKISKNRIMTRRRRQRNQSCVPSSEVDIVFRALKVYKKVKQSDRLLSLT